MDLSETGLVLFILFFGLVVISFFYQLSGDIFSRYYKQSANDYSTNLSQKVIFLLLIAFIFLILAILSVYIFTRESFYSHFNPTVTGYIGDTIGGITNPFINTAAVIVTGLAFYMQYKANKLQVRIFKDQIDETKKQFEVEQDNQRKQNKVQQIETQFYEMLKLHKANIDELNYTKFGVSYNGRKVFEKLYEELSDIYHEVLVNYILMNYTSKKLLSVSYSILFYGLYNSNNQLYAKDKKGNTIFKDTESKNIYNKILIKILAKESFGLGHSYYLAHIYRHLFVMVKFISSQPDSLLSYNQKRMYLRLLRAQLSNHEQVMLFYNWYSGCGTKWQEDVISGNKFFTDYRMIHNLDKQFLLPGINLDKIKELKCNYKTEDDRETDFLFEFEG